MKSYVVNSVLCLAVSLLLFAAATAQERIKPCECLPCGGQVECDQGSTGWCECRNDKCHGGCLTQDRNPRRYAASVLTVIAGEGKAIPPGSLQEDPQRYAGILGQLLKGRTADETYRIEYGKRNIGFVFTPEAAAQLEQVRKELETGQPSPSPSPPPETVQQERPVTIVESIKNAGWLGLLEITLLSIMSVYSIAIMVERLLTYRAAKQQSRHYAPRIALALKNMDIEKAMKIGESHKESHLAMVVNSGLYEVLAHEQSSDISDDEIEASKNALQRAIEIKTAEFRRGLPALAAISWAAPRFGLLGFIAGLIYALQSAMAAGFVYNPEVAANIINGLFMLVLGFIVGISARLIHIYFTSKVEGFIIEMKNSASELMDYFLKKLARSRHTNT